MDRQETQEFSTSPIGDASLPVISDDDELLKRGICRVKIPDELDCERWAEELSQVTPLNLAFEGDGEYAFYRNILDEPEFPFECILLGKDDDELSKIGTAMLRYFPVIPGDKKSFDSSILSRELRLDDAFCVHYNMDQDDTSGAKHVDPSDITVNMCLHKSADTTGSYVLFYGSKQLEGLETATTNDRTNDVESPEHRFLVPQLPGFATLHFGDHPHETTPLHTGSRTNIILTYMYTDTSRTDASTRSCYG
eukprot:CAMPEP_0116129244 /NCGR_PEP_ID=MMETSP0329-20121206/7824_1 /TAXON_ID=697910 /ORGANISM="Pseudo-nitzschia arenysensis, Strain B593" /LENGTH=250 /DNA_ID=CAMNT_0003623505 /DNA_START=88 /DNA_END=840 /DNA_ORIENTATION=+